MNKVPLRCAGTLKNIRSVQRLYNRPETSFIKRQTANGMATKTGDDENDSKLVCEASLPNNSWSDKTKKLYNELVDLCKDGKWEKITSFKNFTSDARLYTRCVAEEGKLFEYAMFFNREEQKLRAVVQFGPWLQGPKGAVHGGAIATIFDSAGGVLAYQLGYRCVTVNLNVNFHGFLPLHSTAECIAWITKKEGRKIFIKAEMRNIDDGTLYDSFTALFLEVRETSKV
ncbi:acyl-coenzyme A thioesterase THEM4-like isoform X2 [Rhopilema esculentum]|uniref:acyl-coenzyme A thioesterase THEM4-like isoform X2 n=1 Tax=Rhopilema esculentum TaxID=499914 RepID=UPI0031DAC291